MSIRTISFNHTANAFADAAPSSAAIAASTSRAMRLTTLFITTIGYVLLFSALTAGAGKGLLLLGSKARVYNIANAPLLTKCIQHAGLAALNGGKALFLAGKYSFLSVAVPIYTATWIFPKWVVQHGIPRLAHATHKYVLIPVYKGVIQTAQYIQDKIARVAQYIYRVALVPLCRHVKTAVQWTWNTCVIPLLHRAEKVITTVYTALLRLAHTIHRSVLKPLAHIMQQIWNGYLIPLLHRAHKMILAIKQSFVHIAQTFRRIVVQPLIQAAQWAWRTCIIPTLQFIEKSAAATRKALVHIAHTIYHTTLLPLANALSTAAQWTWRTCIIPLAQQIEKSAAATRKALMHVARIVYHTALHPLATAISTAAQWTWRTCLLPLAQHVEKTAVATYAIIARIARLFYHNALQPLAIALSTGAKWTWNTCIVPPVETTLSALNQAVCSLAHLTHQIATNTLLTIQTAARRFI